MGKKTIPIGKRITWNKKKKRNTFSKHTSFSLYFQAGGLKKLPIALELPTSHPGLEEIYQSASLLGIAVLLILLYNSRWYLCIALVGTICTHQLLMWNSAAAEEIEHLEGSALVVTFEIISVLNLAEEQNLETF